MRDSAKDIIVSTDVSRFELDRIYDFLHHEAYWCKGLPRPVFDRSIKHSLCFGAFTAGRGTGRICTDHLGSRYFRPSVRRLRLPCLAWTRDRQGARRGGSRAIPISKGLRRFTLSTSDAAELYARYGFRPPARPERLMEIANPRAYQDKEGARA